MEMLEAEPTVEESGEEESATTILVVVGDEHWASVGLCIPSAVDECMVLIGHKLDASWIFSSSDWW